jgi:hydroxymethylpyrimidine pyrophosphatase-like HAD family hydrolase
MAKIDYFIVDLDGCVSDPFKIPDWSLLSQLRALSDRSYSDNNVPQLSICTGRPAPYTEAVGQWLNVQLPVIFESGAGMLNLSNQAVDWNPSLPSDAHQIIAIMMDYIQDLKKRHVNIQPEVAKQLDAGFTSEDTRLIAQLLPEFEAYVAKHCPQLVVHGTDISMSALWPVANKGAGLRWWCDVVSTSVEKVAFIGDTSGDIPAIEAAGISFTPQNGNQQNQHLADITTKGHSTRGVLEAWDFLIEHNKTQ